MVRSVVYQADTIRNSYPHPRAAPVYVPLLVIDPHGRERRALLTPAELLAAIYRSDRNPEDWPGRRRPWWRRLWRYARRPR